MINNELFTFHRDTRIKLFLVLLSSFLNCLQAVKSPLDGRSVSEISLISNSTASSNFSNFSISSNLLKDSDSVKIKGKILNFKVDQEREYRMNGGGCDLLLHLEAEIQPIPEIQKEVISFKIFLYKNYIYDSEESQIVFRIQKGKVLTVSVSKEEIRKNLLKKMHISKILEIEE